MQTPSSPTPRTSYPIVKKGAWYHHRVPLASRLLITSLSFGLSVSAFWFLLLFVTNAWRNGIPAYSHWVIRSLLVRHGCWGKLNPGISRLQCNSFLEKRDGASARPKGGKKMHLVSFPYPYVYHNILMEMLSVFWSIKAILKFLICCLCRKKYV